MLGDGHLWVTWRPGAQRFDVQNVAAGPVSEATVTLAPASGTRLMTLIGLSLEVGVDDPTPIKPLAAAS